MSASSLPRSVVSFSFSFSCSLSGASSLLALKHRDEAQDPRHWTSGSFQSRTSSGGTRPTKHPVVFSFVSQRIHVSLCLFGKRAAGRFILLRLRPAQPQIVWDVFLRYYMRRSFVSMQNKKNHQPRSRSASELCHSAELQLLQLQNCQRKNASVVSSSVPLLQLFLSRFYLETCSHIWRMLPWISTYVLRSLLNEVLRSLLKKF